MGTQDKIPIKVGGHPVLENPQYSIRKSRNPTYQVGDMLEIGRNATRCIIYLEHIYYSYTGYLYKFKIISGIDFWNLDVTPIKRFEKMKHRRLNTFEANEIKAELL